MSTEHMIWVVVVGNLVEGLQDGGVYGPFDDQDEASEFSLQFGQSGFVLPLNDPECA